MTALRIRMKVVCVFRDDAIYRQQTMEGIESNGDRFKVSWQEIEALAAHSNPLYPDGLLDLLIP